ncbi:hypothetical protein [Aliiruegeria lutimaris]|uniref:Uncharacterized protein n=1 Tax=Aliiruegeria lutimaris TaxID=571298 RepID=A0A1G9GWK2_9RHOB|nr:hypothetical protein [Aliiruegeria lutimaris]SDL05048.1 hypothetical protein SAMN04488026_106526 [Aliiruegeria lutimaris]
MFETSRRKLLGASLIGAGVVLSATGFPAVAKDATRKGRIMLDRYSGPPKGLVEAANFPLIEAIHGRRSRRFAKGATIPDGPLAYSSTEPPESLTGLEQMLLLTTVAGNTGWSNLIPHNRFYAPKIPNYAGAAGGRTFPSAAGFHTSEIFFTDDTGTYMMPTRDMAPITAPGEDIDLAAYLAAHKARIVRLGEGRMHIPAAPQHMEMHNAWCANVPGSTLIIPVADLAQHMILVLCYLVQNGACLFDDINGQPIPAMESFRSIVDVENPFPLSYVEQLALTEVTVETSTSCYAGALMLQALGLGGWMYEGLNPFSVLGASGDPEVPGLGFRFDMPEGAILPHVTGLEGHFEGHVPPHFPDMRTAVMSVVERKFGTGGPFNAGTGGPYKKSEMVRANAAPFGPEAIDCVVAMADYIHETFGRFPATVPAIFTLMYLQAHKLDTGFYDTHFDKGAYLQTHAENARNWG